MLAVVKYGNEDMQVELRDVPEPRIGDDEVLLKVGGAGVCGSDVEMWRQHINAPVNAPVTMGHEFCGTIVDRGSNVTAYAVGDRVASETAAYICGTCSYCRTGDYNLCPKRLGFGYGTNGAFTTYVKVPQRCLHRVPDNLSLTQAAVTEPVCVVYNALVVKIPGLYKLKPGDRVADAVKAAGGATVQADVDSVNLAARVEDGEQIYLPKKGEGPHDLSAAIPLPGTPAAAVSKSTKSTSARGHSSSKAKGKAAAGGPAKFHNPGDGIVHINSATAAQFEQLPGIGPAMAQRILDYRKQNGAFKSVDDLNNVKGIGDKKLAKMRPFLAL